MILEKLKRCVESHAITMTEEELLNHLKNSKRWPLMYPWGQPSVEIINNVGTMSIVNFFTAHNYTNQSYLNFDKWYHYYNLGYTTIVSNIFDLNDELRSLHKKLSDMTGVVLNGNFYFSKPNQIASFDSHNHNYDVIVKQIYGESDWVVGDNKFSLKPQKVAIVPKTTNHMVTSKKTKKLSLTINIQ